MMPRLVRHKAIQIGVGPLRRRIAAAAASVSARLLLFTGKETVSMDEPLSAKRVVDSESKADICDRQGHGSGALHPALDGGGHGSRLDRHVRGAG
jgi:hypothetical protein